MEMPTPSFCRQKMQCLYVEREAKGANAKVRPS